MYPPSTLSPSDPPLITLSRILLGLAFAVLLAADAWVLIRRDRYRDEIARLRASMTVVERQRADAILAHEGQQVRMAVELLRRQARLEPTLHLSIALDSGTMALEREGAVLRMMPVELGPERTVGIAPDTVRLATPRGVRTVARVLGPDEHWDVPRWVYADLGRAADSVRTPGVLGPAAIILDGGAVIYSVPATGPLSDAAYVLPGGIRARADDLRAILPSLSPGMRVYLY